MPVSSHLKPGLGPRHMVKILTVQPSKRKIEAALKDGGLIHVATFDTGPVFVWPVEGEYWTVRQENGMWMLDKRVDVADDHKIDNLMPGQAKIQADVVKTISGKSVVAVNDSKAVNKDIIIYDNNQWTVSLLSDNIDYLGLNRYYGAFSDYTNQYGGGATTSPGTANTAAPFRFGQTDENNGVSMVSGSKITFAHAGTYNVQWSGQFDNSSNSAQDVSVWLRKNNVDPGVVGSTGLIAVPASHGGVNGHTISGWNFVFTVAANDYYEFMWSTTSTAVSVQTYPVATSPARPSTAGLVLTVTPVR